MTNGRDVTLTDGGSVAPRIPFGDISRLFKAGGDRSYRAHTLAYGPLDLGAVTAELIGEIDRAGLVGRGGAGFPAARKLGAGRQARDSAGWGGVAAIVANGAEGEPKSLKDETLLRHSPHLVVDGLLAAARAVGAKRVYFYAAARSLVHVEAACRERSDARAIKFVEAPEAFVSGEASAVVNAIENGIALPTDRTVRLTTSGLRKKPTVVHNVETLAHVALIARFGAAWFRSAGSPDDPGTRLVTVSGLPVTEQVLEVPGNTSILSILAACGADESSVGAVLVGGYHGAWLPGDKLRTGLSRTELAPFGAQPGAGILLVVGRDECGLRLSSDIVRYLASESAGQCGPCMFGLPKVSSLLDDLVWGRVDRTLRQRIRDLSDQVAGRGSCHHPDGTSRMVLSTLATFRADSDAHLRGTCLHDPRLRRA